MAIPDWKANIALRDIMNVAPEQRALPNTLADDVVAAAVASDAGQAAQVKAEEAKAAQTTASRTQKKDLTLAELEAQSEVAGKRRDVAEQGRQIKLSGIEQGAGQFDDKVAFENQMLDTGKGQADKALTLSALGTAVKLGEGFYAKATYKDLVAKQTNQADAYDDLMDYIKDMTGLTAGSIKKRKETEKEAHKKE